MLFDMFVSLAEEACQRSEFMAQSEDGDWEDHYDFCLGFRHAVADGQTNEEMPSAYQGSLEASPDGALYDDFDDQRTGVHARVARSSRVVSCIVGRGAGDDACHKRYCAPLFKNKDMPPPHRDIPRNKQRCVGRCLGRASSPRQFCDDTHVVRIVVHRDDFLGLALKKDADKVASGSAQSRRPKAMGGYFIHTIRWNNKGLR